MDLFEGHHSSYQTGLIGGLSEQYLAQHKSSTAVGGVVFGPKFLCELLALGSTVKPVWPILSRLLFSWTQLRSF